jgi:drug/metabolite transporter (DMT)-like permease
MDYRAGQGTSRPAAIVALLTGATVWGLIWYPYRLIEAAGISAVLATTLTYGIALALGLAIFRKQLRGARVDRWLVAIALSSAACNLGYVVATIHGEVMRVLLLFYLAPLWTVLLARLFLHERLNRTGTAVVGLSVAGAVMMLWHPASGLPLPRVGAEWMGLAAGFLFALSNVLIRRADHYGIELKSVAVFAGVVLVGAACVPLAGSVPATDFDPRIWVLLAAVGLVLLVINPVVQYGLTRVPASRAVVILLFELVVAAIASWWLADERMGVQEWVGGGLIVAASLSSSRMES